MKSIKEFIFITILIFSYQLGLAQRVYGVKQVMIKARKNNPNLITKRFDINVADADIVGARLHLNPEVQNMLLLIPTRSARPASNGILSPLNTQPWLQIGSPIRIVPKRRVGIDAAKMNLRFTSTNIKETERNLIFDAATQWLNAWIEKVNLEIVNRAKLNIDTLVSANELRVKNKKVEETDLLRVQILYELYELQQKIGQQQLLDELNDLSLLLGIEDTIDIDTKDPFDLREINDSLKFLINYALENRSDKILAKNQIDRAKADYKFQNLFWYPDPFIGGIFNPQNGVGYAGYYINVKVPIFNRNQGNIQKAKALVQQSESNLRAIDLKIKTEVTIAYHQYTLQKNNLHKYTKIATQSVKVVNAIRDSYLNGKTTIIDYLEAHDRWFDTQKLYYQSIKNYRQSYLTLLYTTGMINEIQ